MIATECDKANCSATATATVMTGPEAGARLATASPRPAETAAVDDAGTTPALGPKQVVPATNNTLTADDIKLFMKQVVVWPGKDNPGWINLHCHLTNTNPNIKGGKPFVVGWPFKTVDELLSRAAWVQAADNPFFDCWYCTSQQRDADKNPKAPRKLKAKRLASNATWLKALWIDIDVKAKPATWDAENPGKPWTHYETVEDAWAAFRAFRAAVGLPYPSAVVNSGGGLHIYWISDQPLAPDAWRPYAEGLKALLLREGVKCDTGLTTDNVRILRVPGTLNHKYSPPRKVELVHFGQTYDFPTALTTLRGVAPTNPTAKGSFASLVPVIEAGHESAFDNEPDPAFASLPGADDLAAGIERRSNLPLHPAPVFEKCGFMRQARDTGGADYDQTLWMYSVLSATFLEGGEAIAHAISKGHQDYTATDTQAMYQRKLSERTERGVGWPSCAAIQGAGCKSCATCPHLAKRKSPLHLTAPVTATATASTAAAAPTAWSPAAVRVTFSNIRHRRTLYGYDLVRGEITVLGSPGGVGKSSLAIGMAVSITTGKELLEERIRGGDLKVLLINAEDSGEEINRRVWAFCIAHGVSERELSRLFVAGADNPCVQRLSLLRTNLKGQSELDDDGFTKLREALQTFSPDVVVLDPLVALCASGNMNDNAGMTLVMRTLKGLAAEFDCAMLIVHHNRKGGEAGSAEAISGAAAIVNLARRAIMPVSVSIEEAPALGILPSERLRHFKLIDAKSNLAPRSTELPVYRLHGIELPNAEPPTYPLGDNVQAVVRLQPPSPAGGARSTDDEKIGRAILDLVKRGKAIDGNVFPYSPNTTGAANVRGIMEDAVTAARSATAPRQWAAGDLEAVVATTIKKLLKDGTLVSSEIPGTGRFRRGQGLQLNPSLAANGDTDAAETEA